MICTHSLDLGLDKTDFLKSRLRRDFDHLGPELRVLEKQGFVRADPQALQGWRVRPQAFLWWLADEVIRTVRDEVSFENWLQAQALEGLLTREEKRQLRELIQKVSPLLQDGAKALIEATAKGLADSA